MTKNEEQKLLDKRWIKGLMVVTFAGISYGFVSLAIDSGSLAEYALAIIFFVLTVKYAVRTIRNR